MSLQILDVRYTDLEEKGNLEGHTWCDLERKPKAIIVLCHGMQEHVMRYDSLARKLVQDGYDFYAYNQRGHKGSIASKEDYGFISEQDGIALMARDLITIIRRIKENHPQTKIILLGHSMGSFISQRVAALWGNELDGLILSGSNRMSSLIAKMGYLLAKHSTKKHGAHYMDAKIESLAIGSYAKAYKNPRTNVDWLNRDETAVDQYIADEWCGGHFPVSFYRDLTHCLSENNKIRKQTPATLPILLIAGSADPVGNKGKGVKALYKDYKHYINDVSIKLYPEARHEILFEQNKEEVYQDVKEFLDKITK